MTAQEIVQDLVEPGFGLQIGEMANAIEDRQFGVLKAGDDLGGHPRGGPWIRRARADERGDVEASQQGAVVRPFRPAAQRRGRARGRRRRHHGVNTLADSGRARRTVQAGVHVLH
ncbi:MAG TPA: hypothetical protein VFB06_13620, partial [Streptosporangiaceae bacterium]|nr:hypothetical protein [Streptosporangiaceae bacterium]